MRYNYGFQNDFVPRHLVISTQQLKYYRNERHANNKKANNMPIVSMPISVMKSIKKFKIEKQITRRVASQGKSS